MATAKQIPGQSLLAREDVTLYRQRDHDADQVVVSAGGAISFGPFRLFPAQRLLLEADKTVPLGSRALDILITLIERAGEVVSKTELMARVWPDTFVDEGNLRVQVATLRRMLSEHHVGRRYVANVPGRGYLFVAPVTRSENSRRSFREPQKSAYRNAQTLTWIGGGIDASCR
jgi:DNA-binding winged helix-turn-helix (wHTH) protein